jgi:sugar transferase (PEP-CTERM/EpsH1 system associated)
VRILFLTHRLPYAANRGDRIRTLNVLRELAQFSDVDLVSLVHDAAEARHAADLQGLACSVTVAAVPRIRNALRAVATLRSSRPLTHALLQAPTLRLRLQDALERARPDVVVTSGSGIAGVAADALAGIPHVLDMVDVDSEKWRALGAVSPVPMRWLYAAEASRMATFEATAAARAQAVLVVTERERAALHRLAPGAPIHVVPNGIQIDEFTPTAGPAAYPIVTFCGVMSYPPNAQAVKWFATQVWPLVRSRIAGARFQIVGSDPGRAVRALGRDHTISVTGAVSDVRPYLWRSAVSVAPLRVARGVQNKVLEAVAAGLPCVVSPVVGDGLPAEVLPACRIADSPAAFASAVTDLLSLPPEARRATAAAAALDDLSWSTRLRPLRAIILSATRT